MNDCVDKMQNLIIQLDSIPNLLEEECDNIDENFVLIEYEGNKSNYIIDCISKYVDSVKFFYTFHIDAFNSLGNIMQTISKSLFTELNKNKCYEFFYERGCNCFNTINAYIETMNATTVMPKFEFNITSVKFMDDTETSVDMVTVADDNELIGFPPGLLVYHTGHKIPKFILTTGNNNMYIEVPKSCSVIGAEDDLLRKYTIFNTSISSNKSFNTGFNNFYIDKEASIITGIPEDETRNFRHPMQNNRKQWNGYNVFKHPKFGDSALLDEQLNENISSDRRDLYQYSLWMTIIGLTNYQKKNKGKVHAD